MISLLWNYVYSYYVFLLYKVDLVTNGQAGDKFQPDMVSCHCYIFASQEAIVVGLMHFLSNKYSHSPLTFGS